MPFETFVEVDKRSRSHDDHINCACPGHNFYIYAWISK